MRHTSDFLESSPFKYRIYLKTEIFFSVFQKKKINVSTRGVFELFSPVHSKLLKRWKHDTIPYWACVMLWYNDVVKWCCFLMYDIIVVENLRFCRSKRKRKPGKPAFSKVSTLDSVFEKMGFRWPFQTEILDKFVQVHIFFFYSFVYFFIALP